MRNRWLFLVVVLGCATSAPAADPARVREAAERLYIHGMTASIADAEVGRAGVPDLLALLQDPAFSRPDNIVAFLAYLGGPESTPPLLASLDRPLPADAPPEAVRARLLVPHALGRIASRGEGAALAALLAATADRARGGPIGEAARRGNYPSSIRDALTRETVAALALAGGPQARLRLEAIAEGRIVPDPAGPKLAAKARGALAILEEENGGSAGAAQATQQAAFSGRVDTRQASSAAPFEPLAADPATSSIGHRLTFANHPAVSNKATTARVDSILQEGTLRVAAAQYGDDIACCATVSRSGNALSFGSSGDGFDTIDGSGELSTVLAVSVARVKVVNAINYCGGAGTNIIGCSYLGGNGMVLVRLTSLSYEAVLWIHEYGHNLGLQHSGDNRALMYSSDTGNNNLLSLDECLTFHSPSGAAQASTSNIGTCTADGDSLADPLDNCPLVDNESQTDTNQNGIGDACEACSGAGDPDGDGVCPPVDNCPTVSNPNQANFDGDPYGDACETGALRADADLSGRVDGIDLARLGRAFGSISGGARYDLTVDFDRDGQVDGADLALLAPVFGKKSF